MNVLTVSEKKQLIEQLHEQYGIETIPHLVLQFGKERFRIFSGHFSRDELLKLDKTLRIENAGLYAIKKEEKDNLLRLTIDGVNAFKEQITKHIVEISDEQTLAWLKGEMLSLKETPRVYVVLKHTEDFVGCGKSTGESILNMVPKERRIKH
jgi:NOL1/NOP2/fmu family ribosome biogenesis protein